LIESVRLCPRQPDSYPTLLLFETELYLISLPATMSTEGEDKSAVQTPTPGSSSAGLHIPDAMDGFFGYTEEKSLKQVFGIVI
jgi:hypothetical protein